MKSGPLTKEKKIKGEDLIPLAEESYFNSKHVKSAVEWLLKEIENEERYALKMIEKKHRTNYFSGVRNAFIVAKCLIKKAFEGVLRE